MKKTVNQLLVPAGISLLLGISSCSESPEKETAAKEEQTTSETTVDEPEASNIELKKNPSDYLPKGFIQVEKMEGDLNKDGMNDCVLLIKGTKKEMIVEVEDQGKLDRNRRGIIVLLKHEGGYEQLVKNESCFSSENEDGGVYFPPELSLAIKKGNLLVEYGHGRYGYWSYTFRHSNGHMELIGYDNSENQGPVVMRETSINFLTKKKQVKENTNENAEESGDEVFEETWSKIKINQLLKLSEITDFDDLDMSKY